MNYNDDLIYFIQEHLDIIDRYEFDRLYEDVFNFSQSNKNMGAYYQLTSLLLEANIDPINYLTTIPVFYLYTNKNISDIVLPYKITRISAFAFDESNIRSIDAGNSNIKSIQCYAFAECPKLSKLILPNTLEKLDDNLFNGTFFLTEITYLGTMTEWCTIKKAYNWANNSGLLRINCLDGEIEL